jgi:hypothetical protein
MCVAVSVAVRGRPQYQAGAVAKYLSTAKNLPDKNYFNTSGSGVSCVAVSV